MIAAAETRRRLPNRRGHELLSFEQARGHLLHRWLRQV
jgi:hypothetical protein